MPNVQKPINSHINARKESFAYPIFGAFLIPIAIGFIKPSILSLSQSLIFWLVLFAPLFVGAKIVFQWHAGASFIGLLKHNFKLMPPGFIYG